MNPYNWQSHQPRIEIPRSDVDQIADVLRNNGSAVVLGGRGMGKSVFLQQIRAKLENDPATRVVLMETPPAELTVKACLDFLANELDVPSDRFSSRRFLDAFFAREGAPERLILLFDEFDRYAEKGEPSSQPPGRGFFNDLEASRRSLPQLGILAVGSIGIFILRDVLGSSFLSRAVYRRLRPLERADTRTLAQPFRERGTPLSAEALDSLFLASGGIPAILTFGLQYLWPLERSVTVLDVVNVYRVFSEEHAEYLADLLSALTNPRFSDGPLRVWRRIQAKPGRIARRELESALGEPSGLLNLKVPDALHLLEAVGVIRLESSAIRDDPVTVFPIAGLLNLPESSREQKSLGQRFLGDMTQLLERLHRSSADFFRPGKQEDGKHLVPEAVFAGYLVLGFDLLGWRSERESQLAAGRTDILLRRNGDRETLVVEVKIWGRNDYREAQRQVESYWTQDVVAGAVVQLTDADISDWSDRYSEECLDGLSIERISTEDSPIRGHFRCKSQTADGLQVVVDHFLVRLARRDPR